MQLRGEVHQEQFITESCGVEFFFLFGKDLVHTCQQPDIIMKNLRRETSRLYVAIDHPGTWPGNGFALTFLDKRHDQKERSTK